MAEWQYGIGSIKYRWNLSGSYQQVIPRYVSIDKNGVEYEFLVSYFSNIKNMVKAIFSKGYEWPFDPGKIVNERSSVIDIAVYIEKYILNRKVFLDFTKNPGYKKSAASFDIRDLDPTAHDYLYRSQAIGCTPVDRLKKLNLDAYELYRSQNIDLENEYLEIDILPQHHNGGAEINIWWETSVLHLFAIGECAGSHGVHRPGGAALNSGQTGGLRAASYIAAHVFKDNVFINYTELIDQILKEIKIFEKEIYNSFSNSSCDDAHSLLVHIQKKNNKYISFLRSENSILTTLDELNKLSEKKANPSENPGDYFRYREILLLSRMFCHAVLFYINKGGKSRGSHLILDNFNDITTITRNPDQNQKKNDDGKQYKNKIINTRYDPAKDEIVSYMRPVRPLPSSDTWFENIWHEYHNGTIWTIPPSEQI
ncbi:MAG: FAD-binding protein [Leptospirales bacterium]|nr:FAD-binding protein [Leptospirales bacterium]